MAYDSFVPARINDETAWAKRRRSCVPETTLPSVKSYKDHLGLSLIVIFGGSAFLAMQIANGMNLSTGSTDWLFCGLITAAFVGGAKINAAQNRKLQAAQKRENEIESLRERITRLEREARERNRPSA